MYLSSDRGKTILSVFFPGTAFLILELMSLFCCSGWPQNGNHFKKASGLGLSFDLNQN